MYISIFLSSTVYLDFAGLQEDLNLHQSCKMLDTALEVLFGAAWGFLDGYSVVAWLATCKTARYCSSGWLEKSREAKRKFQEVRDYVCSGRVLLPGFDDEANMHISLLPLNPAKSFKSHNWGIFERFCRDNPFLNEWCFAKLTSSYEPWWHQIRIKDHTDGAEWPPFHEELLCLVHLNHNAYAPSLCLAWYCQHCDDLHEHEYNTALFYKGVAFGEFYCVLMAKEV